MLLFIFAMSPILLVLIGMIGFNLSGKYVGPAASVYAAIICILYFNKADYMVTNGLAKVIGVDYYQGAKEGFKIFCLIWPAFIVLKTLMNTGAIEKIKEALSGVTDDKRIQLILIGELFVVFLEGAAGAGSPAAVAGPFLVALGIDPVLSAAIALIGDGICTSYGGAGLSTIGGGAYLVQQGVATAKMNGMMAARLHIWGYMIAPALMVYLVYGRKGFKNLKGYLLWASLSTPVVLIFTTHVLGPEFGSLGTGAISLALSAAFLMLVKFKTPEEYKQTVTLTAQSSQYGKLQAFAPYILIVLGLPIVRFTVPWKILTMFGYIVWVNTVLFLCSFFGAMILKVKLSDYFKIVGNCFKTLFPAFITIGSLLVVSSLMNHSGMIRIMAEYCARIAGRIYPAMAVLIGGIGAFITGTCLGSNIMFAPMHLIAAQNLNLNVLTIFAGSNTGGSLGNMICPNNVIAAAATVGVIGKEGAIMKKTFKAFFFLIPVYMIATMIYTFIVFPNWTI